jgi:hypothetical protein
VENARQGSKPRHRRKGSSFAASAFVTDRALLGIKSVGSNAEHVVALDADSVDDGTYDGAGLGGFGQATRGRIDGFLNGAFTGHGRILAWRGLFSIEAWGHHGSTNGASLYGHLGGVKDERGYLRARARDHRAQNKQRLQGI